MKTPEPMTPFEYTLKAQVMVFDAVIESLSRRRKPEPDVEPCDDCGSVTDTHRSDCAIARDASADQAYYENVQQPDLAAMRDRGEL